MNPVSKALWYIESHFTREITLDELAEASHVSRFYMSRAFATLVGQSMQRYLRGRRVSEAAKRLVDGTDAIMTIALDHGYGSHEAFTRAFREHFDVTPESVRAQGHSSSDTRRVSTDVREWEVWRCGCRFWRSG